MKKNVLHPLTLHATVIRVVAAIAIIGSASALAGCTADSGGDDSGSTTLKIYGWKGSDTEPADIPKINAAFEAANPGVSVEYEFIPNGDPTAQRLQPELLAGTGPDVFMADGLGIRSYVQSGYLSDLSDEGWAADIAEQVTPFVTVDDAVYGAPLELVPIGLYANMDLLKEAGVTAYPTTPAEFTAALEALKAAGLPGLAVPDKAGWTDPAIIGGIASTLVYGENPDWDQQFVDGDVSFADWSPSIEQFLALGEKGLVDYKAGLGIDEWSQGLEDFKAGKSAFLYQGGWNLVDFQKSVPSVQLGPWPASEDGVNTATAFSGINWVVNSASKNEDLAKKWVDFFVSSENLEGFLTAESAYNPYTGGTSPQNDAASLINEAVDAGRIQLDSSTTWGTVDAVTQSNSDIQSLVLGDTTTSEMLKGWDESFR